MSTFKEIRGQLIKSVSSDPANASGGDMWYNSTSQTLKGVVASGAWSSGAPTIEVYSYASSSVQGTQTASLIAAGGSTPRSKSESYNGIGFSAEASLNNGRGNSECGGGAGTATAALCYNGTPGGGPVLNFIEEYNGTSWSEQNDLSTARMQTCGAGSQTAALCFSGYLGPPGSSNATEEYNGTSWSGGGALSTARRNGGGNGIQTSALMLGGINDPTVYSNTEEYNGSTWTAGTSYPTNIRGVGVLGSTSSDVIAFGGNNPPSAIPAVAAKQYDGTAWTAVGDLAISKQNAGGMGTTSTGLAIGGNGSAQIQTSEEYNFSTNVITPGAWASGGSLSTARRGAGSGKNSQTLTAGLVFGGGGSPYGPIGIATEEYDGSSFSGGGNMNTPRYLLGGAGTQTSALGAGGYSYPPPASIDAVEEYNGSSWTNVTSLPQIRQDMSSFGTQTAAILASGRNRPGSVTYSTTLSYNGTSWTALGSPANVNTARIALSGSGTQTAGLATGGNTSPYKQTEEWNGSAWTSQNSSINEHENVQSSQLGIQTNALICGGGPSPTTATEGYDGTSWSTRPNMATGRYNSAGGGSATSGFIAGGFTTANTAVTEEFTGETVSANIKTFTTS